MDSYEEAFWSSTLTNVWLNAIRLLGDDSHFQELPSFMQTGAWLQQKMNTQLSAWAELRHDNLLYAKQSYTGGAGCSFPKSYVEPYPEFYLSLKLFADKAGLFLTQLPLPGSVNVGYIGEFFQHMSGVMDTLASVAQKELKQQPISEAEKGFLSAMLYDARTNCVPVFTGWYPGLLYNAPQSVAVRDRIVADVHTAPTDRAGNPIGKILHVGTGDVNLGVFVARDHTGTAQAYCGPVLSYHEYVTLDFQRLTDEEWSQLFDNSPPARPDWVNLYLADAQGNKRAPGREIITSVTAPDGSNLLPQTALLRQNYPNPFNAGTVISFDVPSDVAGDKELVNLRIYNLRGQVVKVLVDEALPAGTYAIRWDGEGTSAAPVASGMYFYQLQIAEMVQTRKLTYLK